MTVAPRTPPRDLARTKDEILRVATDHFTRNGYFGARVDEIAAETSTTKRMIYYCFESKDGLFEACLAKAYEGIRELEQSLHLDELEPRAAVVRYVEQTIRYHDEHPELARLARAENLLDAAHMKVGDHHTFAQPVVDTLDAVLARGREAGVFRSGPTPLDLHLIVSAFANFRITNAPTIEALFGRRLRDAEQIDEDIDTYCRLVLSWLDPRTQDLDIDAERPSA